MVTLKLCVEVSDDGMLLWSVSMMLGSFLVSEERLNTTAPVMAIFVPGVYFRDDGPFLRTSVLSLLRRKGSSLASVAVTALLTWTCHM
jgi:hypothetical protein